MKKFTEATQMLEESEVLMGPILLKVGEVQILPIRRHELARKGGPGEADAGNDLNNDLSGDT